MLNKKYSYSLIIFSLVVALVLSFFAKSVTNAFANENTNITIENQYHGHEHYLNLTNATSFVVFKNYVLLTQNNQLVAYDKDLKFKTTLTGYSNVSNLVSTEHNVMFLQGGEIVVLDENLQPTTFSQSSVNMTFNSSLFSVSKLDNSTYLLTYIENNNLHINHFNDNLEITNTNQLILDQEITTPISITQNQDFIFIAYTREGSVQLKLYTISLSNPQTNHYIATINTPPLHTSFVAYANIYDKNLLFAITKSNQALSVLEVEFNSQNSTLNTSLITEINIQGISNPSFITGDLLEINALQIVNNELYVLDKSSKSLQVFTLEKNENVYTLEAKETFIASTGFELGRYFNPNSFEVLNQNTLLVADTQNNRVVLIENNTIQTFKTLTLNQTTINLNLPQKAFLTHNNKLVIYNKPLNQNQIIIANLNGNIEKIITTYTNGVVSNDLGNITDLAITTNNTLYALSNGQLLYSENFGEFKPLITSAVNTISPNAKITTTLNGLIVIYNNNNLYLINKNGEVLNTPQEILNVKNIDTDFENNIFILTQNNIAKLSITNNFELELVEEKQYSQLNLSQISTLQISKDSGEIYFFNIDNQQFVKVVDVEFSSGLLNYTHPIDILNNVAFENLPKLATTNKNTKVYSYPNFTGTTINVNQNESLYIIHEDLNFTFVLFHQNSTLVSGYVFNADIEINELNDYTGTKNLQTVTAKTKIFTYPTLLKTTQNQTLTLGEVDLGTILTPLSNEIAGINGATFYAVSYNGKVGFVNTANVVEEQNSEIVDLITPNAKLFNLNGKITVYLQPNEDSELVAELNNNKPVLVVDYDKNNEFTKIIFLNDNNQEIEGYVKTHDILLLNPTEQNFTAVILAISGTLLIVLIGVTYLKLKNKKESLI